jgi:hypothetical protein
MRISLLVAAAAMLAGPALAQTTEPKASDALTALDKDCQDGKVQACTEASIKRGPSGPERPGSGKEGAREAEEARHATPGAAPMPPATQRR